MLIAFRVREENGEVRHVIHIYEMCIGNDMICSLIHSHDLKLKSVYILF